MGKEGNKQGKKERRKDKPSRVEQCLLKTTGNTNIKFTAVLLYFRGGVGFGKD